MNSFDSTIETYLSSIHFGHFATQSIQAIADLYTFKGLVLIAVLWWIWFQQDGRPEWRREIVLATLLSGVVVLFVGRLLAHWLPFRVRPIYSAELHLQFASGAAQTAQLSDWSSFPSDHAMLWMAIATGIFLVWRGIGVLALLYTALFICVPRAYLGFHYPTDLHFVCRTRHAIRRTACSGVRSVQTSMTRAERHGACRYSRDSPWRRLSVSRD
ncbi:undecaprenyl-diphosphatase [Paraburkholderia sp. MM5384-R2]|nr:undecaprenyl-diphosphatase [Paraburkholderia sp. MM5384-R2]